MDIFRAKSKKHAINIILMARYIGTIMKYEVLIGGNQNYIKSMFTFISD